MDISARPCRAAARAIGQREARPPRDTLDNGQGALWFRISRAWRTSCLNARASTLYMTADKVMNGAGGLIVAITREHVLHALANIPVDAGGTSLVASGRLSEILIDDAARIMFSIAIDPSEAAAMERVRQAAEAAIRGRPGVKAGTPLRPTSYSADWPAVESP